REYRERTRTSRCGGAAGLMSVTNLTVERRQDPIGIDALAPRFSWRPAGDQSAYQIRVRNADSSSDWSTPLWDSGRRESAVSTYTNSGGPPLTSRQRYEWRVRAWPADDNWSEPASFEMGLLSNDDWSARWIAHVVPNLFSDPEHPRPLNMAPLFRQ